jgi:hypothetical protein
MIRTFRKKPVEIQAIEYDGTPERNREIIDWTRGSETPAFMNVDGEPRDALKIHTLEGDHTVTPGDFVIRGVAGEFYPCKPDIFAATYEEVK